MSDLAALDAEISGCRACPRLVAWREQVAVEKRASYREETYCARPVPGFGDPEAWLLVVGLAPAAHGANRTGRVFTGDRSGDFLFAALHRGGLANQPESRSLDDGLVLTGCRVTAAVRCAPPANKPTPGERAQCLPFLQREVAACPNVRVLMALGGFAWDALLRLAPTSPKPRFGHGAVTPLAGLTMIGSYHPSQQNTFTGRLTPDMLDEVFAVAARL